MNKQEFTMLFEDVVEQATLNAEKKLGRKLFRNFAFILHGAGCAGRSLYQSDVIDTLYLGQDIFYAIIDIGVIEASRQTTTVFLRASSHAPVALDKTWNQPIGNGPFKQIIFDKITIVED